MTVLDSFDNLNLHPIQLHFLLFLSYLQTLSIALILSKIHVTNYNEGDVFPVHRTPYTRKKASLSKVEVIRVASLAFRIREAKFYILTGKAVNYYPTRCYGRIAPLLKCQLGDTYNTSSKFFNENSVQ